MFRFSLTVWLAMASVAAAADPVLMAFGKWGQGKIFPATSEATLGVFVPGSSYAITVTAADVGRVFPLPPDKVAAFASPFTDSIQADPYRLIGGICCYGPSNWVDNIDVAWADGGNGLDGYRFVRHVPVADFELRGYKVTSVEMIVDKLQFDTVNKHTTITAEYSTVWRGTPISAIPGDFNIDGNVDAADYVTWRNAFGSNHVLPNGTGYPPWTYDYDIWRKQFGKHAASSSAVATPEPAAWLLMAGSIAPHLFARRRFRQR